MKARKSLYNEDQKMDFINDSTASINSAKTSMSVFYSSAPYEEAKGSDICTWTQEEIAPVLDEICGITNSSRFSRISVLRQYAKWAVMKGIPGAKNEVGRMEEIGVKRVEDASIRSPEHLQHCLDLFFNPESEETTEDVYRCFFWLAYGGMPEEVIHTVTAQDVDFENMLVRKGDDVAVLYRQALPAVRNCVRLRQMRYNNNAYVNAGDIYRNRVDDPSILRGVRGKPSVLNMRTQISRKLRLAQEEHGQIPESECLTYWRVWRSGVFYRIFEKEMAGMRPDFLAIARASDRGRRAVSGRAKTDSKVLLRQIATDFENDYSRWKTVVSPV